MADGAYNRGLDELATWTTNTFKFLLLKGSGYTFNKDHDYVSDLTPGSNEMTGTGYVRATAATKVRTINDSLDRITYDCDDPIFGSIAAGQTATAMVLFRFVTADSDSPLIAYYDIADTGTNGTPFSVVIPTTGVAYVDA